HAARGNTARPSFLLSKITILGSVVPCCNTCRSIEHKVLKAKCGPAGGCLAVGREMFDVIVVGGGPAGLSAALMLGRCRRRVLLCVLARPPNRRSRALHGYLTRDGIAPAELNEIGRGELAAYGIDFRCTGVTSACRQDDHFRVRLGTGIEEDARYL